MYPRRRRYGGRRGGGGIGLVLLALQLMNLFNFISRSNGFYPITLGVLGLNIAAYLQPGTISWPSLQQACISVQGVWFQKQWKRLFLAPFFHSSDFHLYYNMASFMWKAISLERHFGTPYFLYMLSVFSIGTSTLYIGLNYMLAEVLDQWSYVQSCAVGFSGVIFALKVVTTHMQPRGFSMVMGFIPVPMRLACWVELVLISVLFPNVSFVGHLAGILVGLAFVSGPLKTIMDIPLSLGSMQPTMAGHQGGRRSYTYRADTSGYRGNGDHPNADSDRGHSEHDPGNTEEQELQAAIQRSLNDGGTHTLNQHPSNHTADVDLQTAIERSLAETDDVNPPQDLNSIQRSPPYNPNFLPNNVHDSSGHNFSSQENVHSSETVVVGTSAGNDQVASLRRRPVAHSNHENIRSSPHNSRTDNQCPRDNVDTLRAARLRRFGNNKN